jgi:hypothetical protein
VPTIGEFVAQLQSAGEKVMARSRLVKMKDVPDGTVVWHYMRFSKLVSILDTGGKVFFPRPFKFDDRWEGRFPPSYLRNANSTVTVLKDLSRGGSAAIYDDGHARNKCGLLRYAAALS